MKSLNKNELVRKIRNYFSKKKEVLAVYLYGSQVTSRTAPWSDVDIGVLLKNQKRGSSFDARMKYSSELMSILSTDNVDVVILNDTDLFLVQQVFSKGIELWTRNRKKSEELKWYLLKLSWDFMPVMRIFYDEAIKSLRRMAYGH